MGIETHGAVLYHQHLKVELPRAVWELKRQTGWTGLRLCAVELPRAVWELKLASRQATAKHVLWLNSHAQYGN